MSRRRGPVCALALTLWASSCVLTPMSGEQAAALLGDSPSRFARSPSAIRAVLERGDGALRAEAAEALDRLGPEAAQAVPTLAAALCHRNALVRRYAVYTLVRLGPRAAAALEALERAVADEDWYVSVKAAEAVDLIRGARGAAPWGEAR
ncbi:MAG: HEAT repeat domain-containing protein [Planctomycetes bacterium]|nr:HEAT repeat domain-containing protein [Planctomycetota bacterium]